MKKYLHWADKGHLQLYLGSERAKGRKLLDEVKGLTRDNLPSAIVLGGIKFYSVFLPNIDFITNDVMGCGIAIGICDNLA